MSNMLKGTSKMLAPAGGRYKNYDYVYLKNNKVYSYHGEGQFVFTKDFFPPNHEIYAISNQ